jgi:hypothetical protein
MESFDLKNLVFPSSNRGEVPEKVLQDLKGYYPESNAYQNYGVYMPRNTKVKQDFDNKSILLSNLLKGNPAGYVRPNWESNIAHVNKDLSRMDTLSTVMHEAAHTVQGKKDYKDMEGIKYSYYDPKQDKPSADEILASLREEESMEKAGTTWDKTKPGQQVMQEMLAKHPDWSKADVKRYIDSRMFQEHSVMQPASEKPNKIEYFTNMVNRLLMLLNSPVK